jgi:hypothetical protein
MPRYWLGKKSPVGYSSTPSDAGYVLIFPARMGPPRQIADFVKDRSNKSSSWLGRALGACLVLSLLLIFFDGCSRADYIHKISSLSLSDVSPGQAQALSGGRLEPLVLPPYAMDARWWVMHAKQMLREGTWRVRHTATDNAPDGREVHWSSSLSWALCGMAGIWAAISGQPVEQCVAPAAIFGGPIMLLPMGLLLFFLSRRAFGGLPALFFLSALLVSYPFIRCFLAGDTDHHGLVAGLVTASLLSLIAGFGPGTEPGSGRARAKGRSAGNAASQSWAVTSGLLGGAALWISAATALPVLAATIGGALLAMFISRHNQQPFVSPRYWLSWGISGCLACWAFFALEYFPNGMGWRRLEVNHPLYGLSWLSGTAILAVVSRLLHDRATWKSAPRYVFALLGAAALAMLPLLLIWLGGSRFFLVSDPFLMALHKQYITEFRSLADVIAATHGSWDWFRSYPLILACGATALYMQMRGMISPAGRVRLATLLPPVILMQSLTFWQVRWGSVAWALWALWSLVLVTDLTRAKDPRSGRWLWFMTGFLWLSLLLSLGHWTVVRAREEATCLDHPLKAEVASALIHRDVAFRIATSSPERIPVVLAGPTASTEISYHAGCRTLGTLYWENTEGLKKAARIFAAANPAQARSLLAEAGVTHLVLPGWSDFSEAYASLLAQTGETRTTGAPFFRDLLEKGEVPDWLRPLAYPIPTEAGLDAKSVRIFLLAPGQTPAEASYHRGLYYEESGLLDKAVEAYRQAAKWDPGDTRATEALARLRPAPHAPEDRP